MVRCTATEGKQVHRTKIFKQSMSNEYKFYVVMCQVTMMLVWMWMHSFLRLCIHRKTKSQQLKINTHSLFCVKIRKDFYED